MVSIFLKLNNAVKTTNFIRPSSAAPSSAAPSSAALKTREITPTPEITCYNCGVKGYYASNYLQPRKAGGDLREIKEISD